MIVARFYWVSWTPPKLTADEEASIARAVTISGRKFFIARFLGFTSNESAYGGFDSASFFSVHGTGLFYLAFILCSVLLSLVYWDAKELPWWAEAIVIVGAVSLFAAPIFYISMIVATFRYAYWLREITPRNGTIAVANHLSSKPLPAPLPTKDRITCEPEEIMDADVARVLACKCGQRLRVPAFAGSVRIRCPSCNTEWDATT